MRCATWTSLGFFTTVGAVACSSAAPDPTHEQSEAVTAVNQSTLLASVKSQTGSTFEFWDDGSGVILTSEFGNKDVAPLRINAKGLSASQVYQQVAPGRAVPKAITDAEVQASAASAANKVAVSSGPPTGGSQPPSHGPKSAPAFSSGLHTQSTAPGDPNDFCSGAWFYNNLPNVKDQCDGTGAGYFVTWCWFDRGPGGSAWGDNTILDATEICDKSSSNDVYLNISRTNGSPSNSWSIPSSSWRWFTYLTSTNFWGNYNRYHVNAGDPGSWGDIQFAGGFNG